VAAGLVGSGSVALLYACLALGPMSVLTPITALVSAVVPIGVGFVAGERLNALGLIGIAVGLVAVLLICLTRHSESARASVRAVVMGIGAGVCIGLYLVCIDQTTTASGLAPLVVCFVVSVIGMFGVLLVMRLARRGTGAPRGSAGARVMILIVACGVTDAVASMLFLAALRTGELTIVSVLSALSPAGTILLAAIVLRERVARTQVLGLILAAVAAVLLALA
jgi:drug/metabolite transporter (DMT)-like permease